MNYLNEARQYHQAGLKVIPFWNRADGGKSFPDSYARFREAQTAEDIDRLFSVDTDGVCLLCTDGIEAIDVDTKHDPQGTVLKDLLGAMEEFDLKIDCTIQKTKSGGYHIIYRCQNPEGNTKLARRRGEKEAMIETRGAGGLLFVHPTPGYTLTKGSLLEIPENSQEERDMLMKVCKHLDEPEAVEYQSKVKQGKPIDGKTPWAAFDESTDILDLMQSYGWSIVRKVGDFIRMNRPGAKHPKGVDGSVIVSKNIFYPFTSSEQFSPEKGYSPSAVFAILEHRGDFSAAARALYAKGFGDRIKNESEQIKEELPELITKVEFTKFDVTKKVADKKPLLILEGDRDYWIGGRGMIGVFTGHEKSGKSFVLSCMGASALAGGREVLNFRMDLEGGKMLWFDTEQSEYFYRKTQERMHFLAGIEYNPPFYSAYHLRRFTPSERLEIIEHYVYNTKDLTVVVIDGYVDLAKDYNSLTEVQELTGRLMKWSDEKKILIMGVLHVNKGDGKIRGHFGSELKNKCDFVINTTQQETGRYQATNPTGRWRNFPALDFSRDDEGGPVYSVARTSSQFPTTAPAFATPVSASGSRSDQDIPF